MGQAFLQQVSRDARIARLLESMHGAYAFVNAAEPLKTVETINVRREFVKRLSQKTMDCAYFIRDYAEQTKFREFTDMTYTSFSR